MKDKLLKIINTYGVEKQLKYFQSEIFELNEAIINYWNEPETQYEQVEEYHKKHIAEEIADVLVMLKQFKEYYNISDNEIDKIMQYKIDRQLERIDGEDNEK